MQDTGGTRPLHTALGAGRYRLDVYQGTTGSGDLYRATDLRLQRPVQVTLLPVGPGQERHLHDEARRLASLSHPGLATVHDSGVEGGQAFLVTELIDGEPLNELLARHLLPPEEVMSVGAQLADVLAYVHHQGIVHGDIRPSTVLMGWDGRVYLTGFGLPRFTDATRRMPADATAYLAPEEARGFDPGPAADVYALGSVLLRCVTGAGEPGWDQRVATSQAVAVPPGLPTPLGRALTGMTRPDPAERPTAAQCAAMLGDPDEPRGRAEEPPPPKSNALRNWAIGGGLFLLAVVIGVILLNGDTDEAVEPAPPPPTVDAPQTGDRPEAPDLPGLPDLTGVPDVGVPDVGVPDVDVPDVEIPKPPSELPDLPDVPEAPNADDLFTRIEEWFKSWS